MSNPMFVTEWVCTDPDSYQWQGTYPNGAFQMYDVVELTDDLYAVASEVIDLELYDRADIEDAVHTFGYESIENLERECGGDARRLLAEFVFEQFCLFDPSCWDDEKFDSFHTACWFIDRKKAFATERM